MGGAVSIAAAEHEVVAALLGLAPWIPDRLPLDTLRGKRLDVVHGAWDRYLPGIPGVSPQHSRSGFERALAAGAHGTYAADRARVCTDVRCARPRARCSACRAGDRG